MEDIDYNELDPGIRKLVKLLREHGFDTVDSGDGESKCGTDGEGCMHHYPNVVTQVEPEELVAHCVRLKAVLEKYGVVLPEQQDAEQVSDSWEDGWEIYSPNINGNYDPVANTAYIILSNVSDKDLK